MFFLRWLIGGVVALAICAAGFALVQHLMKAHPDGVMVASVSSIVTSIVAVFALFPRKKKKKA
jgi:hypothetical protein